MGAIFLLFAALTIAQHAVRVTAEPIVVRTTTRDPYSPWRTSTIPYIDSGLDDDEYPPLRRTTEGYRGRYTTSYYTFGRPPTESGEHGGHGHGHSHGYRTTTHDWRHGHGTGTGDRWGR